MDWRHCFITVTVIVLIFTLSLSTYLFHITDQATTFSPRIKTLNVVTRRYLESYLLQIENARLKHTESNHGPFQYTCQPSAVQLANEYGKNPKYFDILKKSRFVQTVFLRHSMDSIFEYLIQKYHGFGSNNCSAIKNNDYGADCKENITEVIKSHSLQKQALYIGLPWKYNKRNVRVDQGNMTVTFIHLIENAIVATGGDIHVENIHLVPQGCLRVARAQCFESSLMTEAQEYDEVFVISQHWGGGFYHNTIENLSRLVPYLTILQKYSHIKVHVKANPRFMQLMNIDESRLVYGNIKAKLLYVPAGTPCLVSPLFSVQTLSNVMRENLQLTHVKKTNVIVLIKRSTKRYFSNHNSILEMLQKHASVFNMVVKVFADDPVPDIEDTMSMFSKAAIVVAPHGAGQTNLILSKPGTVLIEGLCWGSWGYVICYRDMAQSLGMIYHGLVYTKDCFNITADDVEKAFIPYLNHVLHL